jgi:hypothetical protein
MNFNESSYNLFTLPSHDATLDEEDSFFFLSNYFNDKKFFYFYTYPEIEYDVIVQLINSYCLFYTKIRDGKTDNLIPINFPINVFRYMMMEDGSWSNYYTVRRKPGYVVEGMYWSNGIVYQVREDSKSIRPIQIVLGIDSITKTMHGFPEDYNNEFITH